MRHINRLLTPLAKATARTTSRTPAAPAHPSPASGFLTIGSTTYINPTGTYPLFHAADGTLTLVINDTDHPITIITESDHSPPPADLILAPGERTETRRGDCVQVG
ncbi:MULTISPECIES: hypothetical protein [unclassified Streptomyces]|uniref:hypothetical protein n=1 Tax=unclassified Streptomyces TaxID=2593676 RepID=UPI000C27D481|nr:hypothetical protein [Streptomyces sp. CB02959]PJN38880.1 hypothetical protein CG747_20175 [Streptomyces sp. CB02959]